MRLITMYFFSTNRLTHSSTNDLMTYSQDQRQQLINTTHNNRVNSLILSSKSNEHSPKHTSSLLTPTNYEQSKDRCREKRNVD